jgi:PBP1b-binding outer membrane lipoprotein LpoB
MSKLISIAVLAIFVSACSYNPVQYEKQRQIENMQHSKLMG